MLILTRKTNEALHIGDDIKITVLSTQGQQVRIGIDAPKDVAVHREEIYRRTQNDPQPGWSSEPGFTPLQVQRDTRHS